MALVASVNYTAKRIYLSVATCDTDLDLMAVGKEVRALRGVTAEHQGFEPMLILGGNVTKIADSSGAPVKATARYIQLLNGCRIVPYNATHTLRVITDAFTDDGLAGRDCFDRTPLSPNVSVDIDVAVDPVEVRYIATGGGGGGSGATLAEIGALIDAKGLAKETTAQLAALLKPRGG